MNTKKISISKQDRNQNQVIPQSNGKVSKIITHDLLTSPEFPFQIPAVQAMEKRLKFQLNLDKTSKNLNSDEDFVAASTDPEPKSPQLFGCTPWTKDMDENHQSSRQNQEDASMIYNVDPHMNVDQIIEFLDDSFNKSLGHKVEEIREQNKEAEMVNQLLYKDRNVREKEKNGAKSKFFISTQVEPKELEDVLSVGDLNRPKRHTRSSKDNNGDARHMPTSTKLTYSSCRPKENTEKSSSSTFGFFMGIVISCVYGVSFSYRA